MSAEVIKGLFYSAFNCFQYAVIELFAIYMIRESFDKSIESYIKLRSYLEEVKNENPE